MHVGCVLLLVVAAAAQTESARTEARALIEKAIQVQGGLKLLGKSAGVHGRFKGSHFGDADSFRGAYYSQGTEKIRLTLEFKGEGPRTFVFNQGKAWMQADGITQALDEDYVKRMTRANHIDRVSGLVTLVRDKGYTFTLLGESLVETTPVIGVKVSAAGQPDVSLYFDKMAGLLRKSGHRWAEHPGDREALHEVVYEDYRFIDMASADQKRVADAGHRTSGPELLDALRGAIPDATTRKEIQSLISQLGDRSFAVRQKATSALLKHGLRAARMLEEARKLPDIEAARRAENCLERLAPEIDLAAATVRLIGARKPAGAAERLLAYLPAAPNEAVAREVHDALAAIAEQSKQPEPALVRALNAADARVRQAALAALGKDGGVFLSRPGRRLYLDGLRLPSRSITYTDGHKRMVLETFEREFYNRLDEALFARPDQNPAPR